jgi:hypothetical protein
LRVSTTGLSFSGTSASLDTSGNATFNGNVSIGGTLTYEDVTNIDSVGVITARAGINATGDITFGANSRAKLFENGTQSGVQATNSGSSAHLMTHDGNEDIHVDPSGYIKVEVAGSERLRIKSDGAAYFSGNLGLGGQTSPGAPIHLHNFGNDGYELKITGNAVQFNRSSNSYIDQLHNSGSILFRMTSSHTEAMRIDSSGRLLKSGQAALTSTSLSHPIQVASASDANAIAIFGRAADDIGELSFYEADKSTKLGELQYRQDHVNFRCRVGDIRFASGGTSETLRIDGSGRIAQGGRSPTSHGSPNLLLWGADPTMMLASTGSTNNSSSVGIKFAVAGGSTGDYSKAGIFVQRQDSYNDLDMIFAFRSTNDAAGVAISDEKLRITSDGQLGVGADNPGDYDGEANDFVVKSANHTGITIASSGSNQRCNLYFSDGTSGTQKYRGAFTYDHNDDSLMVRTAAVERLRITSTGQVNVNQANNNNLLGQLTIFEGTDFNRGSQLGRDNIYLISDQTSADNAYGASIAWSRVQYSDRRAAAIANVQTTSDEDQVGLAFFTHPSADATANIEEKFRITHDGQFEMNGVRNIYQSFQLSNNTNYNWDFTVPSEGGYGNSFYLVAGYNHYYTTSYGAHRTVWFSSRGTSVNAMGNGIEQYHSQSGSWTFSKPNNTTVRITKTAGTYGGSGYGFFHLMYNHF